MNNITKMILVVISLLGVVFTLIIFSMFSVSNKDIVTANREYKKWEKKNLSLDEKIKASKNEDDVNGTVSSSEESNNAIPTDEAATESIKNLMRLLYSWSSGDGYIRNRTAAQKLIKDDNFFQNYFKSPIDADGNNAIDILKMKSDLIKTDVYKSGATDYFALVSFENTESSGSQIYRVKVDDKGIITSVKGEKSLKQTVFAE